MLFGVKEESSHLCGILSVEMEEDPEKAAQKFLLEHLKLFKIKESMEDLMFLRKTESLGGFHVVFQQLIAGLQCFYFGPYG
ncbi:MAG: hypothetical protein OIN83_10190 [Candidatus Methanoperedens sp.]|nr:hypothetical protein [Candidatus Methanoperedens sp.]